MNMTDSRSANANQVNTEEGKLVITRTVKAPRELVFKVWTESEHLKHWWGPTGMALEVKTLDLRPGGIFHFSMTSPDGGQMWAKFIYQEIDAPHKLVYISTFADAEGNTIRPPFSSEFPLEILNIVHFEEQDGRTTLTLQGGPQNAAPAEHAFYKGMFESMQQGFGSTFDQLDAYLAKF